MTKQALDADFKSSTPPVDTLVCLAITEWSAMPKIEHHLMREAARRGYRVLYVDPLGLRRIRLRRHDLTKVGRRIHQAMRPVVPVENRITRLAPVGLPAQDMRIGSTVNKWLLAIQVKGALKRMRAGSSVLWSYTPHLLDLGAAIGSDLAIYHRADDYTTSPYVNSTYVKRQEARAVAVADLCVAANRHSAEVIEGARARIVVPNGIDLATYGENVASADPIPEIGRPRLLFTGTLETWVDLGLIHELASMHPEWQVVLAGEAMIALDSLAALPNVHYLGVLPYDQLPALMSHCDVGLAPYHVNQWTTSACFGKIFQYLAIGLPVVGTPFFVDADYGNHVTSAPTDPIGFGRAVERLLVEDSPIKRSARRRYGLQQTWRARFDMLEGEIQRLLLEKRSVAGDNSARAVRRST